MCPVELELRSKESFRARVVKAKRPIPELEVSFKLLMRLLVTQVVLEFKFKPKIKVSGLLVKRATLAQVVLFVANNRGNVAPSC